MNGKDNFDEPLIFGLSGIKRIRKQKRISKFNAEKGILSEIETGRVYVPEQGIVEIENENELILDCGHSSVSGIGHIADCGHATCSECMKKLVLSCGYPGCFRKLCTVENCSNKAQEHYGIYLCRKHKIMQIIVAILTLGSCGLRVTEEMRQKYFLNNTMERKEELSNGRRKFISKQPGTYWVLKEKRHAGFEKQGDLP